MDKAKRQPNDAPTQKPASDTATKSSPLRTTTSVVGADPILGNKIRLVILDLLQVAKDESPVAMQRLDTTDDELYIDIPYFNKVEATAVKAAIVDTKDELLSFLEDHLKVSTTNFRGRPFEEVARTFIHERSAVADIPACGPTTFAILYVVLFGMAVMPQAA